MTAHILSEHRRLWEGKPVLRAIYRDFYERITEACVPGNTLEIGGGSGNLKSHWKEVVSTDIVPAPWLDVAADAQALPFRQASFSNIVGVDVLHHIERPSRFLAEVERVLKPNGRLILMEPAITPVSWLFYKFFHPEPVCMDADPFDDGPLDPGRKPFDANQAIPTLLMEKHRARFIQQYPNLRIRRADYMHIVAYPLSGGYRPWSLIPAVAVKSILSFERRILSPLLGRLLAFRLFIVIEKTTEPTS
jgi:SAM-dependent methyltransferase